MRDHNEKTESMKTQFLSLAPIRSANVLPARDVNVNRSVPAISQLERCPRRLLPGLATVDSHLDRAGGRQALGCQHASGTGEVGRLRLNSIRGQMECRWGRDPRRPALAGVARAILGGNRRGGGEGQGGDAVAMNMSRQERLFALLASLTSRVRESTNPNGIPSQSPELARRAYSGNAAPRKSQPQRGCGPLVLPRAATPLGLRLFSPLFPRVARSSQPWALLRNPVGILRRRRTRNEVLNRRNGQAKISK